MHHHQSNYQLIPERMMIYVGLAGVVSILASFIAPRLVNPLPSVAAPLLLMVGLILLLPLVMLMVMLRVNRRLAARDQMMKAVQWRGDEQVLDVGCGNGILLLEAAKRLQTGKAWGIDIWEHNAGQQTADLLRQNARIEGVADRVELREVDARHLPFDDASFDVIFASLSLHHVGNRADRKQAIQEMVRVLKPGGRILIYDAFPVMWGAKQDLQPLRVQHLNGHFIQIMQADKSV